MLSSNDFAIDVTGATVESLPENTEFKIRWNGDRWSTVSLKRRLANSWVSAFDYGDQYPHKLIADGPAAYGVVFEGSFQDCLTRIGLTETDLKQYN